MKAFLKNNRTVLFGALFLVGLAVIQIGVPHYREHQQQKATQDFFA